MNSLISKSYAKAIPISLLFITICNVFIRSQENNQHYTNVIQAPRLQERLALLIEYQKAGKWESIYDMLATPFRERENKDEFLKNTRYLDPNNKFMGFSIKSISKDDVAGWYNADWKIQGTAKIREKGCIMIRRSEIYAYLQGEEWYFSGIIMELPPSHSRPQPCLNE